MLSATLVFPITANAAQSKDWHSATSNVIDSNTKTYRVTGSALKVTPEAYDDEEDVRDKTKSIARLAAWNQAVAQGVVKAGTFAKYDVDVYAYDATNKKWVDNYFIYVDEAGWDSNDDDRVGEWSTDGTTYSYYLTIYQTTYKNNITGETSAKESDLTGVDLVSVNSIPKKTSVYTGAYKDITLYLNCGNIKIQKIKSSNKKVIQARAISNYTYKTTSNKTLSKDQVGYYYTVSGEKFYVPEGTKVNNSYATVTLRVYGKKAGKAVVSFDIVDFNGAKTGSAKITVISSKTKPVASITFGGKSLDQGDVIGSSNAKYIYNKQDINAVSAYTTAKSGKLKVTPSDGYKLVRIQVGSLDKYKYDSSQDPDYAEKNYETAGKKYTNTKIIETTETHPVDLNNDGDYDDVVDGVYESAVTYRYKTVKNNKKITLSKVTSYRKTTTTSSTVVKDNEDASSSKEEISGATDAQAKAPTSIKVTLYDKSAKEYVDVYYTIYKKVKAY